MMSECLPERPKYVKMSLHIKLYYSQMYIGNMIMRCRMAKVAAYASSVRAAAFG